MMKGIEHLELLNHSWMPGIWKDVMGRVAEKMLAQKSAYGIRIFFSTQDALLLANWCMHFLQEVQLPHDLLAC